MRLGILSMVLCVLFASCTKPNLTVQVVADPPTVVDPINPCPRLFEFEPVDEVGSTFDGLLVLDGNLVTIEGFVTLPSGFQHEVDVEAFPLVDEFEPLIIELTERRNGPTLIFTPEVSWLDACERDHFRVTFVALSVPRPGDGPRVGRM